MTAYRFVTHVNTFWNRYCSLARADGFALALHRCHSEEVGVRWVGPAPERPGTLGVSPGREADLRVLRGSSSRNGVFPTFV